ncbi:hypothetical protein BH09PLA1_BH09PLA1_31810 [soil metagenome]
MAANMPPSSKKDAPDPSHSYERAHPDREGGMDQEFTPDATADKLEESVQHRQNPKRNLGSDQVVDRRGGSSVDKPKKK